MILPNYIKATPKGWLMANGQTGEQYIHPWGNINAFSSASEKELIWRLDPENREGQNNEQLKWAQHFLDKLNSSKKSY